METAPLLPRIGVYPGTFDPLHNGHLDIIRRCRPLFDQLVVAVLRNTSKTEFLFSVEERVELIELVLADFSGCKVLSFSGLLVDFMEQVGARTIVRGLRAVSDFESEFQMALMNRRLDDRMETVFLTPKEEYSYLSSRLVKEVYLLGGDCRGLLPAVVLDRLPPRPPRP
jgi:pantetheine-phosphate adenylyltransferase